jgi:Zn-dependent protease
MRASISLGRIAGIRVGINASVFLIVAILVAGLATGQLPNAFPGRSIVAYVIAAIIAAVLFLASLLAHELAHSLVARRNGIEVESIVLWLLGGVAQLKGEAKTPGADFRIAIVGPLTSFALAVIFGLAAGGVSWLGTAGLPFGVLAYLAATNGMLAVFNLIPAAPLDGGRVLRAALWRWRGNRQAAAVSAARAGCRLRTDRSRRAPGGDRFRTGWCLARSNRLVRGQCRNRRRAAGPARRPAGWCRCRSGDDRDPRRCRRQPHRGGIYCASGVDSAVLHVPPR